MPSTLSKKINDFSSKIYTFWRNTVQDNAAVSLLSRNESNAIKGLLIILVVLGHNKYVMQGGMSNVYLYSFHVYAFYYLPFLYDFRRMDWGKFFQKNLVRLYVPYTVFFILVAALAYCTHKSSSVLRMAETYLCGSQYMLHTTFGFGSFLWFLPTMLSVLTFRQIYYRLGFVGRNIMLILSGGCLLGYAYMWHWYLPLWWYSPVCLTVGLGMLLPAICLRSIFIRASKSSIVLCFFLLTVCVMIFYPVAHQYHYTYLTINRLICPVLIFSLLLTLRKYLSSSKIIIDLGLQSLIIYLTHQFIYNGCYMVVGGRINVNIYIGLILFVIALTGGYLLSKLKPVRYVFPK